MKEEYQGLVDEINAQLNPKPKRATIHELDLEKIKVSVSSLRAEIQGSKSGKGPLIIHEEYLQKRYPYLYENCSTMFDLIVQDSFDYMPTLSNMFNSIENVQKGRMTMMNADKKIGGDLANVYLHPILGKKKN